MVIILVTNPNAGPWTPDCLLFWAQALQSARHGNAGAYLNFYKIIFMDEKFNEATKNRPSGDRLVDSPVVLMDIPSFIKQLKSEKAWEENDRNSITVFKTDKLRIVIVAMHKNAEMTTDHPDNVLSLQVVEGKIKLFANNDSMEVRKEQVIALHDKISYRVQALKKSVFLLTLAEGSA